MRRGAAVAHGVIATLVLALVVAAGGGVAVAQEQGTADKDTLDVDVRVWQHVGDPERIHISARSEGARWGALGTPRLLLDDGHSRDGEHRFGDITVEDVVVRVSQHVRLPSIVVVNARPVGGDWDAATAVRLRVRDGRSSDRTYRYGDAFLTIAAPQPPVTVSPGGEDVPRLAALTISFRVPPPEADGDELVSIHPSTEGDFAWLDERTLLFQPDFPGWQRGQQYRVFVDAEAAGLEEDHEHAFAVDGRLQVAYVIPGDGDTEVPASAQILVQFSRSVAPLTVLQEGPGPVVLEFDPPLAGAGEWLNTSLYRFTPSYLQPSTNYSVRIPAGLTSAVDGVLEADYTWSFSTTQPYVTQVSPHGGAVYVEPTTDVQVSFSQPMNRASVEAGVTLKRVGGDVIASAFAWSQDHTLIRLIPDEPLNLSTRYEVVVASGMRDLRDGATRTEQSVRFTTVDPPMVTRTSPRDGETRASRSSIYIEYNNPMDVDSFEGRIFINGSVVNKSNSYAHDRGVRVGGGLSYSTEYTVRIAEGVRDRGGRPLPPYEFSFATRAAPTPDPPRPYVGLHGGTFALEPAGKEPFLGYSVRLVDEVRFRLYRLSEEEAEGLLRAGDLREWDPQLLAPVDFLPASDPLREWTEAVPEDVRESWSILSTSLGDGAPLPTGHYLVTGHAEGASQSPRLMISIIDTTVVTKLSHDELVVWAIDYETGEPLAGVEVTAVSAGRNPYTPAESATADADGVARFAIPSYQGSYENPYGHYLVRTNDGGRNGVALTRWDSGASPYELAVLTSPTYPTTQGYLYTDRPIYRPGETVYYKGVVRDEDDASYAAPGENAKIEVRVRGGSFAETARIELADPGTFSGEAALPPDARTGAYRVELRHDGDVIASASFTVAAFRAPEFEVEVETSRGDYVAGESVATEARANFFFEGPLADAPVEWTVQSIPTVIRVEGYEDYSFSDPYYWYGYRWWELRSRGETYTDTEGVARFEAPAELEADDGAHQFTISATVTDQNAQAVANSATVTVHPATWYAGIKPESYIATAKEPANVHLVTVDFQRRVAPNRPVAVRLYEHHSFRGEPRDTLVEEQSVTTGEDGEATVTVTPPRSGSYRLVAQSIDDEGRVARSARFIWVSGRDYASWRSRDGHYIELVADRDRYEVGDVAEVLVPAPFTGATALVTVERGRVLQSESRVFETNSAVLRIPIKDGYVPNVYVGVVLYRPPTEGDSLPQFRIGYVNLSVSTASVELDVRIEPDRERAMPGETVRYEVEVTDSEGRAVEGDVSVAVVDKAVLSLAEDVGPDGGEAFWYERPLGVRTAWSRTTASGPNPMDMDMDMSDDSEASDELATAPGEPGNSGTGSGPPVRSNFQHTALWIGHLTTDENGKASFELDLPDNATTWRARARAVTAETKAGEGESELLVTQPLLVRPALPRFLRVGDDASLRTLVRNGTGETQDMTVAIVVDGVVADAEEAITRRVGAGRSALFEWSARALEEGTATVRFTVTTSGGYGDAVELSFPVHLDVTAETTATGGVVDGTLAVEAVYLPEYVIADRGSLEVSVQASLVGALDEDLWRFTPRSHSQSESNVSIASRVVATVAVQRASASGVTEAQDSQLRADIETLVKRQRGDGGWGWCRSCAPTDMWVTGWVLVALGEARDEGWSVPNARFDRTTRLVTAHVNRATDVERPANVNQHAFLLYALASAANHGGEVSPLAREQAAPLRALVEKHRAQLTNWGRAYVVLGLLASGHDAGHEDIRALLNDLTADTIASANGNHWQDERIAGCMHNSSVRATALVLRALTEVAPRHPLIEETVRWLVLARSRGWNTWVVGAEGMASLGAFAQLTGETRGVYDYQVLLNASRILDGHFDVPARDYVDGVALPLDSLALGEVSRVQFEREAGAEGRLYYGLNLRYVTPAKHVEALNRGFAVSRRYSRADSDTTPIASAALGDLVRVTVTVVAPTDRYFAKVEDFLPAGLEPVDLQLDIVSPSLREQVRRDQEEANRRGESRDYAPWFAWYYNPWAQVDLRDDRLVLLASFLPRGVYEYVYYARATTPGDFFVAPAHAQEAYFPEVFGRGDSSRFRVEAGE